MKKQVNIRLGDYDLSKLDALCDKMSDTKTNVIKQALRALERELNSRYNGWSNYETWAAALWMDNDYGSYKHRIEIVNEAGDDCDGDTYKMTVQVRDWIENYLEECDPLSGDASMYSDILGAAINTVNAWEIAEHWVEEWKESQDD
jgi:hypothetical protein